MSKGTRRFTNWFGLRCRLQLCPCLPTRYGWRCVICNKQEYWDDEMKAAAIRAEGDK